MQHWDLTAPERRLKVPPMPLEGHLELWSMLSLCYDLFYTLTANLKWKSHSWVRTIFSQIRDRKNTARVCYYLQFIWIICLWTFWTNSHHYYFCLLSPKPNPDFTNDFAAFFTHLSACWPSLLILGGFNIHIDNHSLTRDFTSCLDSFVFLSNL